jgi:hypothetical protein
MPKGPTNNQKYKIHNNYFNGGISVDFKLAIPNSFFYSQSLDFRSRPSEMSVLPAPSQVATTTDLIQAMDQDLSGVRWGIGSKGNLYRIDTSDDFSVAATLPENGSAGLLYYQITDQLYIPGQTAVSMYGQTTSSNPGQPKFQPNAFAQSASNYAGCVNLYNTQDGQYDGIVRNNIQSLTSGITSTNSSQVTSTLTGSYTLLTAFTESPQDRCFFSPDIEPFYSIQVYILSKGTGNWTLTLHDSSNNTLGSATVTNANLISGAYNEFVFGKQVRGVVGAGGTGGASITYHFHLTSTVADGTVQVGATTGGVNGTGDGIGSTGDLQSVNFLLFAYRLLQPNNGWHPTALFPVATGIGNGVALCIGNGQYLSTYNFTNDSGPTNQQWVRHQLDFKSGYEVTSMTTNNQYLVIGVERRSTNANRNYQDGALYFWDGTTNAFNFAIDIPMGAPYSLQTFNNVTYFIVAGSLFAWSGGQTVIKVRRLWYQNTDYLGVTDSTINAPNMMTTRYNLLMIGGPSQTTNVNTNFGVMSWGSVEVLYPNSLGLSYTLSNGLLNYSSTNSLQMGCVYNFVDSMYSSWSYTVPGGGTHYGVDLLNNSSPAATSGQWQSLIYDGGSSYKTKEALRMQITYLPLPSGCTITPMYSVDRKPWVLGTSYTTGTRKANLEISDIRFKEIQYGFQFTCPPGTTTPPTIIGVTMEIGTLSEEVDMSGDVVLGSTAGYA